MTARLLACEARKLLCGSALPLLALAAGAMALLTLVSPAEGGPVFMSAGGRMDQVGQSIGFIGNWIDPRDVPGSAMRTAFVYTPFWLLVVILAAVNVLSADFGTGSAVVSKAKGVSLGGAMVARAAVFAVLAGLLYGSACLVAFVFKAGQYGAVLSGADFVRFFGALLVNVLLLASLVMQAALVFSMTRSAFASAFLLVAMQVSVLLGYPSAYGVTGEGAAGNLLFPLTPVFYLMHSCSLGTEGVTLAAACGYALTSSAIAVGAAAFVLHAKEV